MNALTVAYYASPIVIGSVIVACWLMRRKTGSDGVQEDSAPKLTPPPYLQEFRDLAFIELSEERLKELGDQYLEHERENGSKLYMSFCVEKCCFVYWCEERSVPYLELDAIARKFAIENNCRAICVDYYEEFESSVRRARYVQPKTESVVSQPSDVFATFKEYTSPSKSRPIMSSHSNSFRRMGNLEEYNRRFDNQVEQATTSYTEWAKKQK